MTAPVDVAPTPVSDGVMVAAVTAELERCKASDTVEGAIALRLARTLDDPLLGAAQVSSLAAQLQRTLAPLKPRAPREPDAVDEFTAALQAKQQAAAS
jgi:hypothetical protein